jgi:hypothetical protein
LNNPRSRLKNKRVSYAMDGGRGETSDQRDCSTLDQRLQQPTKLAACWQLVSAAAAVDPRQSVPLTSQVTSVFGTDFVS